MDRSLYFLIDNSIKRICEISCAFIFIYYLYKVYYFLIKLLFGFRLYQLLKSKSWQQQIDLSHRHIGQSFFDWFIHHDETLKQCPNVSKFVSLIIVVTTSAIMMESLSRICHENYRLCVTLLIFPIIWVDSYPALCDKIIKRGRNASYFGWGTHSQSQFIWA